MSRCSEKVQGFTNHLRKKQAQGVEEGPAETGRLATAMLLGRQEEWDPRTESRDNNLPTGKGGRHSEGRRCKGVGSLWWDQVEVLFFDVLCDRGGHTVG